MEGVEFVEWRVQEFKPYKPLKTNLLAVSICLEEAVASLLLGFSVPPKELLDFFWIWLCWGATEV